MIADKIHAPSTKYKITISPKLFSKKPTSDGPIIYPRFAANNRKPSASLFFFPLRFFLDIMLTFTQQKGPQRWEQHKENTLAAPKRSIH